MSLVIIIVIYRILLFLLDMNRERKIILAEVQKCKLAEKSKFLEEEEVNRRNVLSFNSDEGIFSEWGVVARGKRGTWCKTVSRCRVARQTGKLGGRSRSLENTSRLQFDGNCVTVLKRQAPVTATLRV